MAGTSEGVWPLAYDLYADEPVGEKTGRANEMAAKRKSGQADFIAGLFGLANLTGFKAAVNLRSSE
jgi:hypothetical protein